MSGCPFGFHSQQSDVSEGKSDTAKDSSNPTASKCPFSVSVCRPQNSCLMGQYPSTLP
jgi:hypothetical protein